MKASFPFIVIITVIALLFGIITGWGIHRFSNPSPSTKGSNQKVEKVATEKAAGVIDKSTFKDQATGILREGGLDGEGSFNLERPGGKSQTVYLTSSTVDLSQYIGKKVKVWGETHTSEKAGWLMDVGYVEVQ